MNPDDIWRIDGVPMLFDRDGEPISLAEFAALRSKYGYRFVARDKVGRYLVLTVWLGINQNLCSAEPPAIFGTAVRNLTTGEIESEQVAATEESALANHRDWLVKLRTQW